MGETLRIQLSESGADVERLDTLTGYLRDQLLQLDVDDVTRTRVGDPPPGTRAFDVTAVGGLLVSLGKSAEVLRSVIAAIRSWLGSGDGVRRSVRLEIGEDALEISEASVTQQERLIQLFIDRHAEQAGQK